MDSGGDDRGWDDAVVATFLELAEALVTDLEPIDFVTQLAASCVELLDVEEAGLLLLPAGGGELQLLAASDERTRALELYQLQASEGPCLESYATAVQVAVDDLAAETSRWPVFAPAALHIGYRSVLAVPLRLHGTVLGALNLFSEGVGAPGPEDRRLAQALADIATVGLAHHRSELESEQLAVRLQDALDGRVMIEQAKGMLAEQGDWSVDTAFEQLRSHARSGRVTVRAAAAEVLAGTLRANDLGTLPAGRR